MRFVVMVIGCGKLGWGWVRLGCFFVCFVFFRFRVWLERMFCDRFGSCCCFLGFWFWWVGWGEKE